jgi:hypothetical protein
VLIFSIFVIFGSFFMFFGKNLLFLLLVFRNCYLKEVATNTRPWGQEITIQNCHLGFHLDISCTEKNKGPSPSVYPKAGYHLFPPITSLYFFGLRPFASRCKQPLRNNQNKCSVYFTVQDSMLAFGKKSNLHLFHINLFISHNDWP